jgi:Winged helix-turn helix
MIPAYSLHLNEQQRAELVNLRDHAAKPYLRERAAALLKVAAGQSITQVARTGLLRRRKPDTVCTWVHAYEQRGSAGLGIGKGRGRRPACFPPSP